MSPVSDFERDELRVITHRVPVPEVAAARASPTPAPAPARPPASSPDEDAYGHFLFLDDDASGREGDWVSRFSRNARSSLHMPI